MLSGKVEKRICVMLAVLLSIALCACAERVDFEDKDVSVEKTQVRLVLGDGETEKLDLLPQLESADLSGSTCYAEILAWWQAHPDVDVTYTVPFPDGTVADNHCEELTLGSINPDDADSVAELLGYLPMLKTLDISQSGLSIEAIGKVAAACPDAEINCSVTINGKELSFDTETVDLRGISSVKLDDAMHVLPYLPKLKTVELGSDTDCALSWAEIAELVTACPDADVNYNFTLYDKSFTLLDTEMDLNHITMTDEGELVRSVVPCMKNLTYLDMDFCGVSNESMAVIRDENPDVKVVWRVWFGDNYSVRTDVEKILASKPTAGGLVRDRDGASLMYCTDVKYLDLGHNEHITDISFVAYMPNLEVAILAMNEIKDLTPLASCTKLEYLELQTNRYITDLSPLASCVNLEHLNIANCKNFSDITPLYGLNKLKRLWLGCSAPVPDEQIEKFKELHPDCVVNTTVWDDPTGEHWRIDSVDPWTNEVYYTERYQLLMEQFGYLEGDYSFSWKDPKYKAAD